MTRLIAFTVLAVAISACGGGDDEGLRIDGVWARATPGGATAGAIYMELRSGTDDRLVGASAPDAIAGTTEVHETVMADDDSSDDHGDHGSDVAMTMRQVDSIDLPAGDEVSLEPGGYHIMLLDLVEPLAPGDTFELTLDFAEAGTEVVEVEVLLDRP